MASETIPTAWQRRVLSVPEDVNVAMLSARGPGKSTAMRFLALRHVVQHGAAARVLIIRRSFPSLRSFEDSLVALFATAMPHARYSYSDHVMRCEGGGVIQLGFLDGEADLARYIGNEITLLMIDEVSLWPNLRALNLLRGNLRSASGVPCRTVIAGNPGGPGHSVVASAFVAGRVPWRPFELDAGDRWVLATGTLVDNPHLGEKYEAQLRAACAGDRALLAAWLEGSWDAIGGAFFAGCWGPHLLLADEDWKPERPAWSTFWSFDFGMSAPGVALGIAVARERGAVGPGGRAFPRGSRLVVAEVHSADPADPSRGMEWPIDVWADEIRAAGHAYSISRRGCADDARGLGLDQSVISELARSGIHMVKPWKASRTAGWAKLKTAMSAAKSGDPDTAWTMIHPRCRYTIETVACLPRDPRRIEDCDTSAVDHGADAWRYAMTYQLPPSAVTPHLIY